MNVKTSQVITIRYQGELTRVVAHYQPRRVSDGIIVFLHGLGCSQESFSDAFQSPAISSCSVCTFDFPGHGASRGLAYGFHTIEFYTEVTRQVMDYLASDRVHLVGHSMGGAVGVLVASSDERVSHLVNVDGNLTGEDCGLLSRSIASQDNAGFAETGFNKLINELRNSPEPGLRAWAEWCQHADPRALHQAAQSLVSWSDGGELLSAFNLLSHSSYLHGSQDDKTRTIASLTKSTVRVVSEAGHFMMVDNPTCFYEAVVEAVTRR